MPTCTLDIDNWCERHQMHHVGRLRELALMDDALGESYRELWDVQLAEKKPAANGHQPHIRRRTDCVHLGPILEKGVGCGAQDIYACKVHGKCTMGPCRHQEHFCMGGLEKSCTDYRQNIDLVNFFGRIVVINLARRKDRLTTFHKELAKGWPFKTPERFEAIDGDKVRCPPGWKQGNGSWGCRQSHTQILERALIDGIDSILVLEDDLVLCDDFAAKVNAFLKTAPDDWGGLWLGGQHMTPATPVKPGVVLCRNAQRTHAYAARGRFLRDLYGHWCSPKTDIHIDWIVGTVQEKHKVYAPDPFLCGQDRVMSDISGRMQPKKFWIPPKGGEPVIVLDCPREVVAELRKYGIHTGYQREPKTDLDVGLVKAFAGQHVPQALRRWISDLQWEVISDENLKVLAVWHPKATLEMVKSCWQGPVTVVKADSVSEAFLALPREFRPPFPRGDCDDDDYEAKAVPELVAVPNF